MKGRHVGRPSRACMTRRAGSRCAALRRGDSEASTGGPRSPSAVKIAPGGHDPPKNPVTSPPPGSYQTVAALPASELLDRIEQVLFLEIRPQLRCDVDLGIGELPEKKIRKAQLAGGADEQVRIRVIARVKVFAEHLRIDHRFVDVPCLEL